MAACRIGVPFGFRTDRRRPLASPVSQQGRGRSRFARPCPV